MSGVKLMSYEELSAIVQRTAEGLEELKKEVRKVNKEVMTVNQTVGGISNSNGDFAEEFFAASINEIMKNGGIDVNGIYYTDFMVNFHRRRTADGKQYEDDIALLNDSAMCIIEVKYRARISDLEKLTTTKIDVFRQLFSEYAGYEVYLGIASASFRPDVLARAKELGLAVLRQKGHKLIFEDECARVISPRKAKR